MQDVFGIDDVEDFVIEKSSICAVDVHERITANVKRLLRAKSLLIIAYIGHGIIDMESNRLQLLSENGSQKMPWSPIHEHFLASADDYLQNLDVLAVLDLLCWLRIRSRKDVVTFTQRFRRAAYALQNAGTLLVSVEALFGELQRLKPPTAPDAVHKIIGSARPLVLPLKHRSPSTLRHSVPRGNETTVLFKISLAGEPNDVILSEFQQLTKTIPGEFKISIEKAYESNSVVFLCRTSWEAFARLRSTLDCVFIASVKGPALVHGRIL
ncbi:hypothetical protein V1506DRAFT_579113 [Lipomyces tetrasporus]